MTLFTAVFFVVTITTLAIVVASLFMIVVVIDFMFIDRDASVLTATDPLANGRSVATGVND